MNSEKFLGFSLNEKKIISKCILIKKNLHCLNKCSSFCGDNE